MPATNQGAPPGPRAVAHAFAADGAPPTVEQLLDWSNPQPRTILDMLETLDTAPTDAVGRAAWLRSACALWQLREPLLARWAADEVRAAAPPLTALELRMLTRHAAAAAYYRDADIYYRERKGLEEEGARVDAEQQAVGTPREVDR